MTKTLDARGLSCPQPVIETQRLLNDQTMTSAVVIDRRRVLPDVGRSGVSIAHRSLRVAVVQARECALPGHGDEVCPHCAVVPAVKGRGFGEGGSDKSDGKHLTGPHVCAPGSIRTGCGAKSKRVRWAGTLATRAAGREPGTRG